MSSPSRADLARMEAVAVELARLAAAEIQSALGGDLAITYKGANERQGASRFRDPASEADERIERLIRERLAEVFPGHGVVGEEMATLEGEADAPVWVIDPIDGTANFVNGLPIFSSSIGVLHGGRAVVGAIWCTTSHALRSGVYHARLGGPLRFDAEVVATKRSSDLRRWIATEPESEPGGDWEVRRLGSAAIECAFAAAGLLRVVRFNRPNMWDVAGGLALIEAAGGVAFEREDGKWRPLETVPTDAIPTWRRPMIAGEAEAVAAMVRSRSR